MSWTKRIIITTSSYILPRLLTRCALWLYKNYRLFVRNKQCLLTTIIVNKLIAIFGLGPTKFLKYEWLNHKIVWTQISRLKYVFSLHEQYKYLYCISNIFNVKYNCQIFSIVYMNSRFDIFVIFDHVTMVIYCDMYSSIVGTYNGTSLNTFEHDSTWFHAGPKQHKLSYIVGQMYLLHTTQFTFFPQREQVENNLGEQVTKLINLQHTYMHVRYEVGDSEFRLKRKIISRL